MAPKLLQFFRNLFPTRGSYDVHQPEAADNNPENQERYVQVEAEPDVTEPPTHVERDVAEPPTPVEPEGSAKDSKTPPKSELEVPDFVTVFLSFHAKKMAEQMTLMDGELFKAITQEESEFALDKNYARAPNVVAMVRRAENLKTWVRELVLSAASAKLRRQVLAQIILLAHNLQKLNNLHSSHAIMDSLYFWPVIRLTKTWRKLPRKSRQWFRSLAELHWRSPLKVVAKHWQAWDSYGPRCVPAIGHLFELSDPEQGLEFNLAFVEFLQTGKFHKISPKNPVLQDFLSASMHFTKEQRRHLADEAKGRSFELEPKKRGPMNQLPWRLYSKPRAGRESDLDSNDTGETTCYCPC